MKYPEVAKMFAAAMDGAGEKTTLGFAKRFGMSPRSAEYWANGGQKPSPFAQLALRSIATGKSVLELVG